MKNSVELIIKVALLFFTWLTWWWAFNAPLSNGLDLFFIVGGVLLVFPFVWLGRRFSTDTQQRPAPPG